MDQEDYSPLDHSFFILDNEIDEKRFDEERETLDELDLGEHEVGVLSEMKTLPKYYYLYCINVFSIVETFLTDCLYKNPQRIQISRHQFSTIISS